MYKKAEIYGLVFLGELITIKKVFDWHCLVFTIWLLAGYPFDGIRGIIDRQLEVSLEAFIIL